MPLLTFPLLDLTKSLQTASPEAQKALEGSAEMQIAHCLQVGIACCNEWINSFNQLSPKLKKELILDKDSKEITEAMSVMSVEQIKKEIKKLKRRSLQLGAQELAKILDNLSRENLPILKDVLAQANSVVHRTNVVAQQLASFIPQCNEEMAKVQQGIVGAMLGILEISANKSELLISAEQFKHFYDHIRHYGSPAANAKLQTLFAPANEENGIALTVVSLSQTNEVILIPCGFEKFITSPNVWTTLLPGNEVFKQFLPNQFCEIACLNMGMKTITAQLSNPATLSLITHQGQRLKLALEKSRKQHLTGWRAFIANLFGRNPNALLDQWEIQLQSQQQNLLHYRIASLQQATKQLKEKCGPVITYHPIALHLPTPEEIQAMQSGFQETQEVLSSLNLAEDHEFHLAFQKTKKEFNALTNVTQHFVNSIQSKQPHPFPVKAHKTSHNKTIMLPDEKDLRELISTLFVHVDAEQFKAMCCLADWLLGQNYPDSFEELRHKVLPLFKDQPEADVECFIDYLMDHYFAHAITQIDEAPFSLWRACRRDDADKWIEKHHHDAEMASYYLTQALDREMRLASDTTESVFIDNGPVLFTFSNTVNYVKSLHDLSQALNNKYFLQFKNKLKERLKNLSAIYVNQEHIDWIIETQDEAIIADYCTTLFKKFLNRDPLTNALVLQEGFNKLPRHTALLPQIQLSFDEILTTKTNGLTHWTPEWCEIIEAYGSETLKQGYRYQWFKTVLMDSAFSAEYSQYYQCEKSPEGLQLFFGDCWPSLIENMKTFMTQLAKTSLQNADINESALVLIAHFLTDAFFASHTDYAWEAQIKYCLIIKRWVKRKHRPSPRNYQRVII